MKRVLVIRFSALGDIILTFPGVEKLLDSGYEVHVLTKQSFAPLIQAFCKSTKLHIISDKAPLSELLAVLVELKKLEFDFIYDFHRNLRSTIVTLFLWRKSRRIRKYRLRELALYLFRKRGYLRIFGDPISRVNEVLRVVNDGVITGTAIKGQNNWKTDGKLIPQVANFRAGCRKGYICIAPESAWREKEWPIDRFVEVAKNLKNLGYGIVWLGLRQLPENARFDGALELNGKLSIVEVAQVLAEAKLTVCNDSGLLHLSEAVGTKVAAIYGPTTRELGFPPSLKNSQIIESDIWCRPCSKTGRRCIRPIRKQKCLADVSVTQVLNSIYQIIESVE